MRYRATLLIGLILFLSWASLASGEGHTLQFFLAKVSAKEYELSQTERVELLNRMEEMLGKAQQVHKNLVQAIQGGEITMEYQEGRFWMGRLEEDRASLGTGVEELKSLKEKPDQLLSSIKLYRSLRNLSHNFNAYNNVGPLCPYVGDLAPEIELWADPVFYELHLLPLALSKERSRDKETEKQPPKTNKKPTLKEKKH